MGCTGYSSTEMNKYNVMCEGPKMKLQMEIDRVLKKVEDGLGCAACVDLDQVFVACVFLKTTSRSGEHKFKPASEKRKLIFCMSMSRREIQLVRSVSDLQFLFGNFSTHCPPLDRLSRQREVTGCLALPTKVLERQRKEKISRCTHTNCPE